MLGVGSVVDAAVIVFDGERFSYYQNPDSVYSPSSGFLAAS